MSHRLSDRPPTWWGRLATRVRGWYRLDDEPLEDKWVKAARLRVKLSPEMRAQFRAKQPTLSDEEVDLVVEAVRQWVRVEGRNPESVLPSRAVYELEELRGEAPRMFVPDPGTIPYNRKDPSIATLELQSTSPLPSWTSPLRTCRCCSVLTKRFAGPVDSPTAVPAPSCHARRSTPKGEFAYT